MSDLVMPRLSDSMEEGTIVRWLVEDGAEVHRGEEIVEIETDKATMTYEADADGVLRFVAAEGDTLPIGAVIAQIGGENGGAPAPVASAAEPATAEAPPREPVAVPAPEAPPPVAGDGGERVKASPVARRIARE